MTGREYLSLKRKGFWAGRAAARRCRCKQDHSHQSGLEAEHCDYLYTLRKLGEILEIETQKRLDLRVNGVKICAHYPDQIVTWKDGRREIIETKGHEEAMWRIKRRLTEALYPDLKYVVWKKRIAYL